MDDALEAEMDAELKGMRAFEKVPCQYTNRATGARSRLPKMNTHLGFCETGGRLLVEDPFSAVSTEHFEEYSGSSAAKVEALRAFEIMKFENSSEFDKFCKKCECRENFSGF